MALTLLAQPSPEDEQIRRSSKTLAGGMTQEEDRKWSPPVGEVLGSHVHCCTYAGVSASVLRWARKGESRYVCVANVHVIMEAVDDPAFQRVINQADLVTPDGVPLVWALRAVGCNTAVRVYGPALMSVICHDAAESGLPIGLLGGTEATLAVLKAQLLRRFPKLQIAYASSPPFRELSMEDDLAIASDVNRSGARILFVGLGCPKQERTIARLRGHAHVPMLGVGAAFDFLAGTKPMAPAIMQWLGLEWSFRLLTEPRRLWKRYLKHNPRFLWYFGAQLLRGSELPHQAGTNDGGSMS